MLKSVILALVLFLSIPAVTYAQAGYYKTVPGKIITKKNDTVDVEIDINYDRKGRVYLYDMQFNITCKRKDYTLEIKPHKVKEVQFEYENSTYRMISKTNVQGLMRHRTLGKEDWLFLQLIIDGKAQLLACYDKDLDRHPGMIVTGISIIYIEPNLIIQNNDGYLYKPLQRGVLNESLSRVLNNCSYMENYFTEEEVYYNELYEVVDIYNTMCSDTVSSPIIAD